MRRLGIHGLAIVLALGAASCGEAPAPPEGFTIAVRFVSIQIAILERLVVSIRPNDGATFAARADTTHEGGAITTRVEPDGTLTIEISGDHVRMNATSPDGVQQIYELQIWSDDEATRSGPRLFAVAYRSGEAIGEGGAFLPAWPPPIEDDGVCTPAGRVCSTQLAVTCYATQSERCAP